MKDFYRTSAGRRFFESDVPSLIEVLGKISTQLERSNDIAEKKRRVDEKLKKIQIKESNKAPIGKPNNLLGL
mgnify:CR=1 FL=1|jgi:hypothetical protein